MMQSRISDINVGYTARGIRRYSIEVSHEGLHKHRIIQGDTKEIVRIKAAMQADEWGERYELLLARNSEKKTKAEAARRTAEAESERSRLASLITDTLKVDDKVDWNNLKDNQPFPESKPAAPTIPTEPHKSDPRYKPSIGLLDRLVSSRRTRILNEKEASFFADHEEWEANREQLHEEYARAVAAWTGRKQAHETKQAETNAIIDSKRTAYELKQASAILEYCDYVLSVSSYPDYFPQTFELDYDEAAKILIVDYHMPAPDVLPKLKAVKYLSGRDCFEEVLITEAQCAKQYDHVLYQIVLRTLHELFEADAVEALETIAINGIVTSIDKGTGNRVTACILSIRVNRSEFMRINLAQVDPKACFKSLKGMGSSKLHGLSPVAPLMPLRRDDSRFVSAYDVANTLDDSVNLAAMDWSDFEHLIRELFEKEFASSGGEVKVTQASRDGGVDAVAFDPDPIRGGKIVIQAKRYTNTVAVGA